MGNIERIEVRFEDSLWSAKEFADIMEKIYKGGYPEFRSNGKEGKIAEDKEKKVAELGRWMGRASVKINGEPAFTARGKDLGSCLGFIYRICPIPIVIKDGPHEKTLVFEREKE